MTHQPSEELGREPGALSPTSKHVFSRGLFVSLLGARQSLGDAIRMLEHCKFCAILMVFMVIKGKDTGSFIQPIVIEPIATMCCALNARDTCLYRLRAF